MIDLSLGVSRFIAEYVSLLLSKQLSGLPQLNLLIVLCGFMPLFFMSFTLLI